MNFRRQFVVGPGDGISGGTSTGAKLRAWPSSGNSTFVGYQDNLQAGLSLSGASQPFDSLLGMAGSSSLGPITLFNVQIAPGTPAGTVFTFAANQFIVFYTASTGGEGEAAANFQITVTGGAPEIPEPASMVLLGTGLAGVAASLRKRWRAKTQ